MKLTRKDGLLYEVYTHILHNSWIPQPELALSASLCVISTLVNRKVTFLENCCNIYCLNIAPSGAGKDAPQQAAKNILLQLGLNNSLGAGDYVSDASLMNTLDTQPVRLDVIDEAAGFLATATKGEAAYAGKVDDILCELYTTSNGYYAGRQLADSRKGECLRPFVNLLMSTTPRGFEQGLNAKSVDKGLLGRNLLFFGDRDVPARMPESRFNVPLEVRDKMLALAGWAPEKGKNGCERRYFGDGLSHDIGVANCADTDYLMRIQKKYDKMRRDEDRDSYLTPIIARGFQMVCKLALIHAVSVEPEQLPPTISRASLDFAETIVDNNIESFKTALEDHVFENGYDEKYTKVRNVIMRHQSISASKLGRKLRGMGSSFRKQILSDLLEFKLIKIENKRESSSKKPTTFYTWIGDAE